MLVKTEDEKLCECGVLTEEECQCVFFDGEPWVDIDESTPIHWEDENSN